MTRIASNASLPSPISIHATRAAKRSTSNSAVANLQQAANESTAVQKLNDLTSFIRPDSPVAQRYNADNVDYLPPEYVFTLSDEQKYLCRMIRSVRHEREVSQALHLKAEQKAQTDPTEARNIRRVSRHIDRISAIATDRITRAPDDILTRGADLDDEASDLADELDKALIEIDLLHTELQQRIVSRSFDHFMGDESQYTYHTGTPGDPIPIIWYKQASHYPSMTLTDPFTHVKTTYNFPNGPVLSYLRADGTDVDIDLRGPSADPFSIGNTMTNKRRTNSRARQQFIRKILIEDWSFDHNGLDGDHVIDLGFDGQDRDENIWPLDETINRRPYAGWRNLYGINYIDSSNNKVTGTPNSMIGRTFIIKGHLGTGGGPVPDEGSTPDPKSGTN